jgi:hypothetical protein
MNNSDKTVWDGVILVASYHFLLALISLLGAAATVVFAIIPNMTSISDPKSIFFPIIGVVVGVILCGWYFIIGSGLISLKNSARMGAVFLALFGSVGGLFVLLGAGIPAVNNLIPDYAAVTGVVIAGLCGYLLMTLFDLIVLVFLFNRRVRALFYGEPWNPENAGPSIASRFRTTFLGESYAESEPELPARPAAVQRTIRRETPPPPPSNPPEDLDTPGDLFTEPAPRKR